MPEAFHELAAQMARSTSSMFKGAEGRGSAMLISCATSTTCRPGGKKVSISVDAIPSSVSTMVPPASSLGIAANANAESD